MRKWIPSGLAENKGASSGTTLAIAESEAFVDLVSLHTKTPFQFSLNSLTPDERRTLENDLSMAARIQQAQLPGRDFSPPGFEIDYRYAPAALVSGDYCDLFQTDDGLLFLLGDVSGKGVASSMLVSHLRAAFRSLSDLPLDSMVKIANRIFAQSSLPGQFATLVAGRVTRNGSVEFISAGHPPFLHISSAGVRVEGATEVPLGLFTGSYFTTHHFSLDSADSLLIYSDGLTEARNPAGEHYDFQRVVNLAAQHHALAPSDLVEQCLSDLLHFTEGAKQTDDLTLLVIRRTPGRTVASAQDAST